MLKALFSRKAMNSYLPQPLSSPPSPSILKPNARNKSAPLAAHPHSFLPVPPVRGPFLLCQAQLTPSWVIHLVVSEGGGVSLKEASTGEEGSAASCSMREGLALTKEKGKTSATSDVQGLYKTNTSVSIWHFKVPGVLNQVPTKAQQICFNWAFKHWGSNY